MIRSYQRTTIVCSVRVHELADDEGSGNLTDDQQAYAGLAVTIPSRVAPAISVFLMIRLSPQGLMSAGTTMD
jgi:hypothetical protein